MSTVMEGDTRVTSEPDRYARGGFFQDLITAGGQPGDVTSADVARARERLEGHDRFERQRLEQRSSDARAEFDAHGFVASEQRALSMTAGAAGEFSPPKQVNELFASVARSASPLTRLATTLDLPDGCDAVSVPRFDTFGGLVVEISTQQNVAVGDDYGTADLITANVVSLEGGTLVSQQWVDRVPMSDQLLARDFGEAYAAMLENVLFSGTGVGGEPLGLLNLPATSGNVPGVNVVTYTNASPTPTGVIQAVSQGIAQVNDNRLRMPDAVFYRGAMLAWLLGSPDGSTNVPMSRPGTGQVPDDADQGAYGPVGGFPAYAANALPKNTVVTARTSDLIVMEDPNPRFTVYPVGGEAGQLSVYVGFHRYVALVTSRWPSGVAVITGSGLTLPAGW